MLTPELFWYATPAVAFVDLALIFALSRLLAPTRVRSAGPLIALVSGLFFAALWGTLLAVYWDLFCRQVFPGWVHNAALVWGLGYALCGLLLAPVRRAVPGASRPYSAPS